MRPREHETQHKREVIIPGLLLRGVSRTTALQRPHIAVSPDLNGGLQSEETSLKETWGSTTNVFPTVFNLFVWSCPNSPLFSFYYNEMKRYYLSHPCSGQFVPYHPSMHVKNNQSYQFWFIYLVCCFSALCFVSFTLTFVNYIFFSWCFCLSTAPLFLLCWGESDLSSFFEHAYLVLVNSGSVSRS